MKRIEKNHWYIKENKLDISLMKFYVSIEITKNDKNVFYRLTVTDEEMQELVFNFYTLEDAIFFTEDIISKCFTTKEVIEKYQELYSQKKFKSPLTSMEKEKKDTITLFPDDIDEALIGYFGKGKNYRVSVQNELSVENKQPKMVYYLIEHVDNGEIQTRLTYGDLLNAFNDYVGFYGYEVDNFKYIGGVRNVGYFVDEDTPYFEGIELHVKEKEQGKKLSYPQGDKK